MKLEKAKEIAFKLLSVRGRSEKELTDRLIRKDIDHKTVAATITYLKEHSYINDERFGYNWTKYRMENNPIGSLKIEYELHKKGIAKKTVTGIIERIKDEFDEVETAGSLAKKRMKGKIKNTAAPLYKKMYGFLLRRGFPREVIEEVLGEPEWE